jgi:hypothetical protein
MTSASNMAAALSAAVLVAGMVQGAAAAPDRGALAQANPAAPEQQTQRVCTTDYLPVCARNPEGADTTYANMCVAQQAMATDIRPGACTQSEPRRP